MNAEKRIEELEKELDAAVIFARTESERAKSAEHWRDVAQRQNDQGHALQREIYKVLEAEGYLVRSYSELVAPRGCFTVVEGSKYAPGEYHVLGAIKHLIERAKKAEAALPTGSVL